MVRERTMPTTAIPNATAIKRAMKTIGLGERAGDLLAILDEMALDAMLERSIAAFDRGEGRPVDDFLKELDEEFANGYYGKV